MNKFMLEKKNITYFSTWRIFKEYYEQYNFERRKIIKQVFNDLEILNKTIIIVYFVL